MFQEIWSRTLHTYIWWIMYRYETMTHKYRSLKSFSSHHWSGYITGWKESGNIVTFRSRTLYKFLPLESPRMDSEFVTLPNMVMMTGMMKPEVKSQMAFIKRQVVWPLLMSDGFRTPFVRVKVSDFLWGYEDELACLTEPETKPEETDWDSEFWSDDEVIDRKASFLFFCKLFILRHIST